MDMNQFTGGGFAQAGSPMAFRPMEDMDRTPLRGYEDLTETEKEHLILQCKDAKTTDVMQRLMDSVSIDMDAKALAEEEAADNSYKDSVK